jgi:Tol biopolymer transport system component
VNISSGANADIWIKQLDKGPSLKLTFDGTINQYPSWTPDGKAVTYESNATTQGAVFALWTKRADGSAQPVIQLNKKPEPAEALWSKDGKWLVVRTGVTAPGSGDIMAIRPGVDSAFTTLVATKFSERSPDFSPDNRFIVYSATETGRDEIYVVPFPNAGSAKWPISTSGGSEPRWSHKGDEIFYRDGAGNMVSIPVRTTPTFSFGAARILFPARSYVSYAQRREYDVTADGKRFLMVKFASSPVPDKFTVVTNWFEELKNKLSRPPSPIATPSSARSAPAEWRRFTSPATSATNARSLSRF